MIQVLSYSFPAHSNQTPVSSVSTTSPESPPYFNNDVLSIILVNLHFNDLHHSLMFSQVCEHEVEKISELVSQPILQPEE